jgi:hypothetical protein
LSTDGDSEFTINWKTLELFWMKPRSLKVIYRKTDDVETPLIDQYNTLIDEIAILEKSKGFINLYRQVNDTSLLFYFC